MEPGWGNVLLKKICWLLEDRAGWAIVGTRISFRQPPGRIRAAGPIFAAGSCMSLTTENVHVIGFLLGQDRRRGRGGRRPVLRRRGSLFPRVRFETHGRLTNSIFMILTYAWRSAARTGDCHAGHTAQAPVGRRGRQHNGSKRDGNSGEENDFVNLSF